METHNKFLQNIRALVVDDDSFMLQLMLRMLNMQGIADVNLCENGREGLDIINAAPGAIDILVLDLNMPEMDGIEFILHLNQKNFGGDLILVSGEDEDRLVNAERHATARKINVLGYVQKPISRKIIIDLLAKRQSVRHLALI